MRLHGVLQLGVALFLVAVALPLAAQSIMVLSSGEDARRCSMAAEFTANLRSASREDLEYCVRALEYGALSPRDRAGTLVNRGIIESALGEQKDAMKSYDRALELVPELPEPYVGRGNVLFLAGDAAGAIAEYNRALELGISRRHAALLNRGMAEEARGNLDAAERDYREVLQLVPDWRPAQSRHERVQAKRKAAAGKTPAS